jgi:hypothetical protein
MEKNQRQKMLLGGITAVGTILLGTYALTSVVNGTPNPFKQRKALQNQFIKAETLSKYKTDLTNFIDVNNNGLSLSEQHKLYTLMGIQDSSSNYTPKLADWNRAYNKVFPNSVQE